MSCTTQYVPNNYPPNQLIDFKALVIRSIDRNRTYVNNVEKDTSSNFTINVFPVIDGSYRVGNITIYNSLYNVTSKNNTIYITQSGTNYSATLLVYQLAVVSSYLCKQLIHYCMIMAVKSYRVSQSAILWHLPQEYYQCSTILLIYS